MSRVLFVVPPLVGHVNPTVSLGAVLRAEGHEVAWCGHQEILARLLPRDALILDVESHLDADAFALLEEKGRGLRGAAAFKFLWEDLFWPLADAMVPAVEAAIEAFTPDVLVVDQQALAGAIVGQRRGMPWVTSAATSANLVDPLDALPQLRTWMEDGVAACMARHGVPGGTDRSPHAVLAFTTRALVGEVDLPSHWHFVGPVIAPRPPVPFPWDQLAEAPTVLVSLGTVSSDQGTRFYTECIAALAERGLHAVVVAPPDSLGEVPSGILVQRYVPQLELLPRMTAVVCHAGHNTVVESLWHDLPLIVAPIRDDQPVVAAQVVNAGAGVRVKFGRARADRLGAALDAVLGDPSYRQVAARIGASFRAAGGAALGAAVVIRVAHGR